MNRPLLKPCPFCGCDAELEKCDHSEPLFCAGCPDCDYSLMSGPIGIGWFGNEKDAARAWNSRADFEHSIIAEIKAELAKSEPEQSAWIEKAKKLAGEYAHCYAFVGDDTMPNKHKELMEHLENLPQKQKPLSDDEIIAIGYHAGLAIDTLEDEDGDYNTGFLNEEGDVDNETMLKFARLIEKAHDTREKNEPAQ